MTSRIPVPGDRPHEEQPSISPMSSTYFSEDADIGHRMSIISLGFGRTDLTPEMQGSAYKHCSTDTTSANATHDDDILDNIDRQYSHSSRDTLFNSLGISGKTMGAPISRKPVPENAHTITPQSSSRDMTNDGDRPEMSPSNTLIGEASPPKSSRWGPGWGFKKVLRRKRVSEQSLAMNSAPISGADYAAGDEEYDGNAEPDPYCPNPCNDCPELCPSHKDIQSRAWHWLTKVVVFLSLYSTVMSGIWLFVAFVQPRWGRGISSNMGLSPSTATLLAAWLAKTIELTFVTTFITFLGQVLTRRAIAKGSRGATLAEMSMRSWVIQPGSLVTHFGMLRYAAPTILGVLSLLATFVAAFYTTASDAMVAPKLKYGNWEHRVLSGYVRSSYSNAQYIQSSCPAMLKKEDPLNAASTCTDVMVSGESYRNLQSFMEVWTNINNNGSVEIHDLEQRPAGTASLHGNTTLQASWIETQHSNVTASFERTGRIINNVTMAMPHPGVASAAMSGLNGILQPDDLSGVGEYAIKAGVVSPSVNVMCVNMAPSELAPLVYTEWPHANTTATGHIDQRTGWENWQNEIPQHVKDGKVEYLNSTDVDDIFRWGSQYERQPPVFRLFPADYNTVVNSTVTDSDAVYILGKSPVLSNYTLCELRSWVSPNCSTQFNISGISGSRMAAHCEDPEDLNSYWRSCVPDQDWALPAPDWRWLADQWRLASDLNGGEMNTNASNAHILTQLALAKPILTSYLPSMAEALAVFASSTLILGSVDTPFRHYWEYTKPGNMIGEPGIAQPFNASLATQEYTSGHVYRWQGIFYVILVFAFLINVLCFLYILLHAKLVTDYTEAHNLFALALNSSQNNRLKGSCGGGPEGRDLAVAWKIGYASAVNHYFVEQANTKHWRRDSHGPNTQAAEAERNRWTGERYSRLRQGRGWL